jgi:predicted DNA-binding transcriptional regulator AlpA
MVNVELMAELLGVSPGAVWARMSRNPDSLPPWFRVGRRCYWSGQIVTEWIKERTAERVALTSS